MSTFTQILYQLVFSTKNRDRTLTSEKRPELFQYIWGVLQNKNCHPYRINGVEDHLHIAFHLHPMVTLASIVKDIKLATSSHVKSKNLFQHFTGWQDGYAAFTYSYKEKNALIEYIINQEKHHRNLSFKEELIQLLKEHGVEYEERYLL